MSKVRVATCACGKLQAEAVGEPVVVSMCHCLECQRRSGSPFGLGAFFEEARVRVTGDHKTFTRKVPEGRQVTNHFCPECGGPLFWVAEGRPGLVGISVGMFADPGFPAPERSVYEARQHPWLAFSVDLDHID